MTPERQTYFNESTPLDIINVNENARRTTQTNKQKRERNVLPCCWWWWWCLLVRRPRSPLHAVVGHIYILGWGGWFHFVAEKKQWQAAAAAAMSDRSSMTTTTTNCEQEATAVMIAQIFIKIHTNKMMMMMMMTATHSTQPLIKTHQMRLHSASNPREEREREKKLERKRERKLEREREPPEVEVLFLRTTLNSFARIRICRVSFRFVFFPFSS